MSTINTRPTLYNIVISTVDEAVEFTVPTDAVWLAIRARDDIIWSTQGTAGDPISSPYSELDAGEGFALPDILNTHVPMTSRLYFAVPSGGTAPAVVEIALA